MKIAEHESLSEYRKLHDLNRNHSKRLDVLLKSNALCHQHVPAVGNCFFEAVPRQTTEKMDATTLRQLLCNHIEENAYYYKHKAADFSTFTSTGSLQCDNVNNWRNLSLLHTYEGYTAFSRNSISETAASRKTRKFVVFGIQGDMQLKSLPFSPTEENITSDIYKYEKKGDRPDSHLFVSDEYNNAPLSRDTFISLLRDLLFRLGYNDSKFCGHSFRIGAATSAAAAGVEDHIIQTLGRWSFD
ncbi:unnamed protein product [Mytilus edulis]|uniref:Tyr recombinase domain-containing protein n=1 Tax=Mytilus edulis TaxID=6550 RepID=A0A8S3QD89_MYTED|nr:unnamed protein product [Mytilus edulis]